MHPAQISQLSILQGVQMDAGGEDSQFTFHSDQPISPCMHICLPESPSVDPPPTFSSFVLVDGKC